MKKIFIVGTARSGTTVLQRTLASHTALTTFTESHFYRFLHSSYRPLRAFGIRSRQTRSILEAFVRKNDDDFLDHVPRFSPLARSFADAFVNILDSIARKRDKSGWIEKTPKHLHFIQTIERYVPGPRFLHILRNATDVVASLYKVTQENPESWGEALTLEQCLDRWITDFRISQRHANRENHVLVRYEDFVDEPEVELQSITDFLDLEYQPRMLDPSVEPSGAVKTSEESWKTDGKTPVENRDSHKFEKLLSPEDQSRVIDRLTEELPEEYHRFIGHRSPDE